MERLMDEISFEATDKAGSKLVIDEAYVTSKLGEFVEDEDLSRFIL
jgi:ATP-dependent HslUV protease ATP-binding subunit HslU